MLVHGNPERLSPLEAAKSDILLLDAIDWCKFRELNLSPSVALADSSYLRPPVLARASAYLATLYDGAKRQSSQVNLLQYL